VVFIQNPAAPTIVVTKIIIVTSPAATSTTFFFCSFSPRQQQQRLIVEPLAMNTAKVDQVTTLHPKPSCPQASKLTTASAAAADVAAAAAASISANTMKTPLSQTLECSLPQGCRIADAK
jgi:hypothetical protein